MENRLQTVDDKHFYFNDILIDMNQLWYHDSKNPRPWGQGHAIAASLMHLDAVAYNLSKGKYPSDIDQTRLVNAITILKRNGFKV